jgi:uncharacterized protein YecE (DUF72 family)
MVQQKDNIHIGCSGFYYRQWRNTFYPSDIPQKDWLYYYSSVFNTVELNSSFYHIPRLQSLQKQFENTPNDFKFSVKVHKSITHYQKLKDCKQQILEFKELIQNGLSHKLGCLLFQFPPSFIFTKEHLRLILSQIPDGSEHVIEFRHKSWWCEEVRAALKEKPLTFCNVDYPNLPTEIRNDTKLFYLRLHGTPDLFKSSYEDTRLQHYSKYIPHKNQAFVFFNNTYYNAGWQNARKLAEYVKETSS